MCYHISNLDTGEMIMRKTYFLMLAVSLVFGACNNKPRTGVENSAKYEWAKDWPQLPVGYSLSQVTGIGVDTMENVFAFHRTGRHWTNPFPDSLISLNTISIFDGKTGKMIGSWGANYFIMPHGLTVDRNNNVWVTDVALQQIFKFSYEGQLLMKIGEAKVAGNDSLHFNRPTDVAVVADGSFYVSDGYLNSRVAKFSSKGKYLFEWGKKGNGPGEFNIPHGISLDAQGNVYVADRENNRVQIFDPNGKFIRQWQNKVSQQLYSLTINRANQNLFAVDYYVVSDTVIKGSDIFQFDPEGNLLSQFGRSGSYSGPVSRYHDVAVDKEGNIYLGDILNNTIQKFKVSH